jgi:hypothetical protein
MREQRKVRKFKSLLKAAKCIFLTRKNDEEKKKKEKAKRRMKY